LVSEQFNLEEIVPQVVVVSVLAVAIKSEDSFVIIYEEGDLNAVRNARKESSELLPSVAR